MDSSDAADLDHRYHRAPCGLIATTPGGVIVEANETLGRWLGRSHTDLEGMSFPSLLEPSSRLFYETRHTQVLHIEGRVSEVALSLTRADGEAVPVFINSVLDHDAEGHPIVRTAVFHAADRIAYERELVRARRKAEHSEARVRILQNVSGAFDTSANDHEVAHSFVTAAKDAFAAAEASVLLFDEEGTLQLAAGVNPLWGVVPPIDSLRQTAREVVLSIPDVQTDFPELAEGLRDARFEAMSVTPLLSDGRRLGVLVCFFGRARDFDDEFHELQRALGRQASQTLTRVRLQRKLEHLAHFDPLTGVPNRQSVEESLRDALRSAEESAQPLALVFLDLDEFKAVNDTLGHAAGDEVLRTLAHRLRASVRVEDIVGRIGGDEFIVICANAGADEAVAIAERIRERSRDDIPTAAAPVNVSVSIGLAVYDPAVDARPTPDQMLIRADGAMYLSKDSGKNRVSLESTSD
ncbi:diguanylate cyclase [Microbacterium sp. P04]|uniref:sensor domain-containing diguanylate cyclase n=1 Tax=Microbacterium sp. P04 TaxID=3366947 RepID=UPI0037470AD6